MRQRQDKNIRSWQWLSIALICLSFPVSSLAEEFTVRDMRVEGLQRISEGTVFNYLPINVGDTVDEIRIQEAIRALYTQKLFDDIEARRDESTLVIVVRERPSIEDFTIDGNKDIKTEDLMESLRGVGLARGRTFDRSVLEEVQGFLKEQYYDRGKYGVVVNADVVDRPNNTIMLSVPVSLRRRGVEAKLVIADSGKTQGQPDPQLCRLVARARLCFDQLESGEIPNVRAIAERDGPHESDISRILPLAFLAPDIVEAILNGRQPVELTAESLKRLRALPTDWDAQRRLLGFSG